MKQYTNKERFAALNRHSDSLSINNEKAFTILTQHVNFKNIEDFADILIHTENFYKAYYKAYGIERTIGSFNTRLFNGRKKAFFDEDRLLTEEETIDCNKQDEEIRQHMEKIYDRINNGKV